MKIKNAQKTLFIFLGLVLASFSFLVFAQDSSQNAQNIFLDSDQDGLSNAEEKIYGTDPNKADTDGDGYTDGAEVKSGYDPLKPAPGDKIIQDKSAETVSAVTSKNVSGENNSSTEKINAASQTAVAEKINLTDKLSTDVASLINQKSDENQPVSIEDIDGLLSQMTSAQQAVTFDDLPAIDPATIKIKKQNYSKLSADEQKAKEKEDATQYLVTVAYIMANNSPSKLSDPQDLQTLSDEIISQTTLLSTTFFANTSYFDTLAEKGQVILDQLKDVEVPEKLLDIHTKGMQLANYAISLKGTKPVNMEDPIASIKNLSGIQNVVSLGMEMSQKISGQLIDIGITEIPVDL
jgi:hypothetical protein